MDNICPHVVAATQKPFETTKPSAHAWPDVQGASLA
jgi:hypothetical protein